ncbi:hypothetical protein THAOC_33664, partial [Thalassiosira oceanica]
LSGERAGGGGGTGPTRSGGQFEVGASVDSLCGGQQQGEGRALRLCIRPEARLAPPSVETDETTGELAGERRAESMMDLVHVDLNEAADASHRRSGACWGRGGQAGRSADVAEHERKCTEAEIAEEGQAASEHLDRQNRKERIDEAERLDQI